VIEVEATSVPRPADGDILAHEHRIDVLHLHGAFNTTNTAV
jgi:hypothetical protein